MGRTPRWSRERVCGVLPSAEEEVAETTGECDELPATPISLLPLCHCWEEGKKIRSELKPSRKGGLGGMCFEIWVYFSVSCFDLIGYKLN